MKRAASRASPCQPPCKLTKRTTSTTVSRNLSILHHATTPLPTPMAPPKWPSVRVKATTSRPRQPSTSPSSTLPLPRWPTLVPTSRGKKASAASSTLLPAVEEETREVSEDASIIAPGLRRMSTLPLEDDDREEDDAGRSRSLSKAGSKSLSKVGSKSLSKVGSKSLSKVGSKSLSKTGSKSLSKAGSLSARKVETVEKEGSLVTTETEDNITTATRPASGSSAGEITALSFTSSFIRREIFKTSAKPALAKKVSSIRVFGTDAPAQNIPAKGKGRTKVIKRAAKTAKGKGKVTAAKTKGKVSAAKTKGKVSAAKTKGKVSASKTKGKVTATKTKGRVTTAKTRGELATGKAKAKASKGKTKTKAATKKSKIAAKNKTKTTKAKVKAGAKAAALKAKGKGVKAVKGRKPVKGKCKGKVTDTKSKKPGKLVPGVKRKFREAVKDEELSSGSCLNRIKWAPWVKAIIPAKPAPTGKQAWLFKPRSLNKRPRGSSTSASPSKSGLRNIQLFTDNQNAPALFEVAVQLKAKKRYAVFFKACASWRKKCVWDTLLLNAEDLRREVNAVLAAGGQIWVRRGNVRDLPALTAATEHIKKYYDYAWLKRKAAGARGADTAHRRVKKCSTLISGNA